MEENQQTITMKKQELPLQPLVVMMPSPGMGHLIPLTEFAKRLFNHHNLHATFLIPTDGPPSKAQTTVLRSLPPGISHIFLPPISLSDLPPNAKPEPLMTITILRSLPSLLQNLLSLMSSHRVSALIVDLFGTDTFDIAGELNIPSYIYFPSTANTLSFALYLPILDQRVHGQFKDIPEPLNIPGSFPVHGKDLPDPVHDRNDEAYKCFLHHVKRYRLAKGLIENSFLDLEPVAINFLQNELVPFYPVGPLVNEDCYRTGLDSAEEECLKWLDEQPRGSVIFLCFGSGGVMSSAQIDELAYGLEMSEVRFLWVVRCPIDKVENESNFIAHSKVDPFDFLPKGFVDRIRGKGFLVPYWAPQALVLSHVAIGGFVTHCGWNSILESLVNGVPLVAWPLYAEQKMNAILVTEEVKVALRPKVNENSGIVERHEVASVVKRLMEGEKGKKLGDRMKDLKEAAEIALKENGSSSKQIAQLALKWKGQATV